MADNFDGSLNFKTRLDTDGFKQGADEIKKDSKELDKDIKKVGSDGLGEIDTKQAEQSLENLAEKAEEVSERFGEARDAMSEAGSVDTGDVSQALDELAEKAENTGNIDVSEATESLEELAKIEETAGDIDTSTAVKAMESLAEAETKAGSPDFEDVKQSLRDVADKAAEANKKISDVQAEKIKTPEPTPKKIVVSTDVDTTGFVKGSDKLKEAVANLIGKFDELELKIRNAFDGLFAQPEKGIKTLEDLSSACDDVKSRLASISDAGSMSEMMRQIEELNYQINSIGQQTYEIDGAKIIGFDTSSFVEMKNELWKVEESVIAMAQNSTEIVNALADAEQQAVARFFSIAKSFDGADLEEKEKILADLRVQIDSFAQSFNDKSQIDAMKKALDMLTESAQRNAQAMQESKQSRQQTGGEQPKPEAESAQPYSDAWDSTMKKMQEAPRITEMVKGAIESALRGIAGTAGSVMAQVSSAVHSPADAINMALGGVAVKAKQAAGGLLQLAKGTVINSLKAIADNAKRAALGLASMAKKSLIGAFNKLKGAVTGVNKSLGGNNINVKKSFMTVMKYAFGIRSLFQAFRKLRSGISDGLKNVMMYDQGFKASVDDLKLSITTLKNAFGAAIAPIAKMVIPVITRIIDYFTEAVNHFGMLTAALSGQKQYIKGSKAQADAYEKETKAAKEAQKTIAGFDDLTILDEKEDKDAPKNVGFDTAPIENGINGLADALKNMWQVADFTNLGRLIGERLRDALNSIPWDMIKAMCAKIGKSIATFLNGFFETPGLFDAIGRTIAQALNSVFEFLNAFVSNLHWASIGNAIREGILGFLDNIDWALIQDTFFKLGAGIAELIGAIFADPSLPAKIGNAIANVINTAFLFVYGFVSTLPWASIGEGLKAGVLGLLDGINWDLIYATMARGGKGIGIALNSALNDRRLWSSIFVSFSNAIRALFLAAYNFIKTPDWKGIGKNIGLGLNDGIEKFPWDLVAKTLFTAVNAVFDLLLNFLVNFNFRAFGEHVGKLISDSIHGIDWKRGGAAIGAAVTGLFEFFNGLIAETDWKAIGEAIIDTISGFFMTFKWESVGEFISNVITGLFNFLSGIIGRIDWYKLPGQIVGAIAKFLSGVKWDKLLGSMFKLLGTALIAGVKLIAGASGASWKVGIMIIKGLLNGILSIAKGFPSWLKTNIFDRFINGVKLLFGIASPATTMLPIGANIIAGLLNGILEPLKNIGSFLKDNIASPIIGGVKKLFGVGEGEPALKSTGNSTIEGFKDGVSSNMSTMNSWLGSNVTNPIADGVSNGLGTNGTPVTKKDGEAVVAGIESGISDRSKGLGDMVTSNVADPIVDGVSSTMGINNGQSSVFNDFGSASMKSLKGGMEANAALAKDYAYSMADALGDAFKSIDWGSIGKYMMEGLYNGLLNSWDYIYTYITNYAGSLFDAVKGVFGIASPSKEFYWVAEMLTAGLVNGLEDTGNEAVGAVTGIADAITEEASSAKPTIPIDTALDGPLNALDETMVNFGDHIINGFDRMVSALQDIVANAGFVMPQTAMGAVVPYSARVTTAGRGSNEQTEQLMEFLEMQNSERLTRDDLMEVLTEVAREYFRFEMYLGDEQVARSANRGNIRLNRRYSPVI